MTVIWGKHGGRQMWRIQYNQCNKLLSSFSLKEMVKINNEALLNAEHFLHSLPVSMHLNVKDIITVLQMNH